MILGRTDPNRSLLAPGKGHFHRQAVDLANDYLPAVKAVGPGAIPEDDLHIRNQLWEATA